MEIISELKTRRLESPSSINTHRQCPRKYYYQYIQKLPVKNNIHFVRGKMVHDTLEHFFDVELSDDFTFDDLNKHLKKEFVKYWNQYADEMDGLGLSEMDKALYLDDTVKMISNYFAIVSEKLNKVMDSKGVSLAEAFKIITPIRESLLKCEDLQVRGYADAIETEDGRVRIIDYKTSKKNQMTPDYELQVSIYALLYKIMNGVVPHEVGILLLKHGYIDMKVDEDMLRDAQAAIEQHHACVLSDDMTDYERRESGLCKWRSGQCDFYDVCR